MKINKQRTDEQLMSLIVNGDKGAFDQLYHRYSKKLLYFLFTKLNRDLDKANDFLQDLFLKVIENPNLFDTNQRFSTWIYNVAYNMCKNEYKKNAIRPVIGIENKTENSPITVDLEEFDQVKYSIFNKQLSTELSLLNEDQQTTFILKYKENFTIKEVSEIMKCSEGTVKSRLFYTIKKLSVNLKEFNPLIK